METAQVLLVLGVTFLAFWRKDLFLYIIAALMLVMLGLLWAETYLGPGVITVALGGYCIVKAIGWR